MAIQNPQRFDLGKAWKAYRKGAGKSPEDVEAKLHWYKSKCSRVESGTRVPVAAEIDSFADLCGLTSDERADLQRLGAEARKKVAPSRVADFAQTAVSLLQEATIIRYFDDGLIAGFAQTADTARALFETDPSITDVDERVGEQLKLSGILYKKNAPQVYMVLGEAALHILVGGRTGLRGQLEHLIKLSNLPNVHLRILTFAAGAHMAAGVGWLDIELEDRAQRRVYLEGLTDATYVHALKDIEKHQASFDQVWALAEDEDASASIVRRRITELE
ncbi:helix-turn-helix domain-containing protein [Lentzea aerocolonigenes]|uniref:helix-turn-helix domain-containing protein n=1 Tax=Lentzea aerocolonigenes TaxID=68170 RepID=UPI0004C2E452|nr:helix-turn-helix transcriptional regulator [Lentzea aerocolonigenes]